jgi:hypothetical protein
MSRSKRFVIVALALIAAIAIGLVWLASSGESGSYQLSDPEGTPLDKPIPISP